MLVLVTAAVYFPVVTFDFVNFDDPVYVTGNLRVLHGLTMDGVSWAFTKVYFANWLPLTWLSHMLDVQIYGLKPWGHHLTNVLFHLANTILLFAVLRRMTSLRPEASPRQAGAVWKSAIVAALFALHPLHVESVAWVAERKDVLSAFFFLLTIWAYARYVGFQVRGSRFKVQSYLLTLLFFVLGLMSKPMLVTLPFVLLLLDYWPLNRFELSTVNVQRPTIFRSLVEKIPFFALTLAASALAYFAQKSDNTVGSLEKFPISGRISNALVSYVRYLGKMIWPDDLAVFYPHPGTWPLPQTIVAGLLLLLVTGVALWKARSQRWLVVGWFWYLGMLVPVIGLVQIGDHAMADRYSYLPLIGIFIMIVWGAAEVVARFQRGRSVFAAFAIAVLAGCGVAAAFQLRFWKNSETLFTRSARVTTGNYIAFLNLGIVCAEKGKLDEASNNLSEALRLKPDYALTHMNLANLLRLQGKTDEAAAHYEEALRLQPDDVGTRYNYGGLLTAQGKLDEAEKHFRAALRLKPDWAELHFKMGYLLCLRGNLDNGIIHYQRAFELKPTPETHTHLGIAFARQKKWGEAAGHLRLAAKALPNNPAVARDLAWVLATCDDPKIYNPTEAVQLAGRACELTERRDAGCLDVLATAYSEARRFDDAVQTAGEALSVAVAAKDNDLATQIRERLKNFQAGKPFRETVRAAQP